MHWLGTPDVGGSNPGKGEIIYAINHLSFVYCIIKLHIQIPFAFSRLAVSRGILSYPFSWKPARQLRYPFCENEKEDQWGFEPPTSWAPGKCEDH